MDDLAGSSRDKTVTHQCPLMFDHRIVTPNGSDVPGSSSRFELIAECSQRISPGSRSKLLAKLLEAASNQCRSEGCLHRPLWAEEAMHRAYNMVKLVRLLEQHARCTGYDTLARQIEFNLCADLAAHYQSLGASLERNIVPCSIPLREVVSNLVALFGPAVGAVELRTDIVNLTLTACKRRALVLAASELVINALSHAFKARRDGRIIVALQMVDLDHACLTVADDGVGWCMNPAKVRLGVAGGLATMLETTLLYRTSNRGGTVAEITFQVGQDEAEPSTACSHYRTETLGQIGGAFAPGDHTQSIQAKILRADGRGWP